MHNARVMATPKPGEIRCPTCHRSTPPAAFCTQCGSAIPQDARARPRGMDRDELQDRIRARRSGGEPYRRGAMADDQPAYERFQPEPEDQQARRAPQPREPRRDYLDAGAAAGAASGPPVDEPAWPREEPPSITRDRDEWMAPPSRPTEVPAAPPSYEAPSYEPVADDAVAHERWAHEQAAGEAASYADAYEDEGFEEGYEYDAWEEPRERRSGSSALAIVGFLGLGVLALLGGALLAGVFSGGPTGQVDTSPSPSVTVAPTVSATPEATAVPSETAAASGSPDASGGPIVFPDGFTAEAQPCLPGSAGGNGCDSNAVSNSGSVWVWVGFENGTDDDVIGTAVIGPDGNVVGEGSIDLARIGCSPTCPGGWTYFPFSGLPAGTYDVEVTRNGEPAATTSFEVS
jgi:hypothetical protein